MAFKSTPYTQLVGLLCLVALWTVTQAGYPRMNTCPNGHSASQTDIIFLTGSGPEVARLIDPTGDMTLKGCLYESGCADSNVNHPNLVLHYPFENNADDVSGNSLDGAADASCTYVDVTASSSPLSASTYGLQLGSPCYVDLVAAQAALSPLTEGTISFWARLDIAPGLAAGNVDEHRGGGSSVNFNELTATNPYGRFSYGYTPDNPIHFAFMPSQGGFGGGSWAWTPSGWENDFKPWVSGSLMFPGDPASNVMALVQYRPSNNYQVNVKVNLVLESVLGSDGVVAWLWITDNTGAIIFFTNKVIYAGDQTEYYLAQDLPVQGSVNEWVHLGIHARGSTTNDLVAYEFTTTDPANPNLGDMYTNSPASTNPITDFYLGKADAASASSLGTPTVFVFNGASGIAFPIYKYGQWGWAEGSIWPFVGESLIHSGPSTDPGHLCAVIKYDPPHAGEYHIVSSYNKFGVGGDGIEVRVYFGVSPTPAVTYTIPDANPLAFDYYPIATANDSIYFVVDPVGTKDFDATALELYIAETADINGPIFAAENQYNPGGYLKLQASGSQAVYQALDNRYTPLQTYKSYNPIWDDTDWHHVAITCSPKGGKIYVDGNDDSWWADNANPFTGCGFFSSVSKLGFTTTANTFLIGKDNAGNFGPSNMAIDDFAIWDAPLSPGKIKRLASGKAPVEVYKPDVAANC